MNVRIILRFFLLITVSTFGSAQTTPPSIMANGGNFLISGISEPPEMRGPAKVVPRPSLADESLLGVMKQAGPNGFTKASVPALNGLIKEYPNYADGYYWRAQAEACGSHPPNLSQAEADLQKAIVLNVNGDATFKNDQALSLQAKLEIATGHQSAGLNLMEKSVRSDLGSAPDIFNIEGTHPESSSTFCIWNLNDLNTLERKAPHDWRPFLLEALYYQFFTTFNENYYAISANRFRKAAALDPQNPIIPYLQGELHRKAVFWKKIAWSSDTVRNSMNQATLPFFTRAIHLDLSFEPGYEARAETYLDLKRDASAIQDFDKAISLRPDNTTTLSDRGLAKSDIGDYYGATTDFGDAIRLMKPGDDYLPNDYVNRGDAYVKLRNYSEAIEDYSSAIRLRLQNEVILWSLPQFRGLYPEYAAVSDSVLLRKLNALFCAAI